MNRTFVCIAVGALLAVSACEGNTGPTGADEETTTIDANLASGVPVGSTLATTGSLNLRSGAGTSYGIIDVMPSGATVTALASAPVNGFFNVQYGTESGWASGSYLKLVSTPPSPDSAPVGSTLATTGSLNLRSGAGTSYGIIDVMPSGATVTLLASGAVNGFLNVQYGSESGWASAAYLRLVSTTTPPPPPPPPPGPGPGPQGWAPGSKGLWIWYFDYIGYTAAQAAAKAQADGIGYVLIKSGQSGSYWSTRYNAANVAEFTSRGIKVFAWPYVTPSNVSGTINAVAQAAAVPGTSGIVLDAEIEFEGAGTTAAKQLCQGIRSAAPGVWLGYTSFGWVGYHTTFPFHTFDQYCGDGFFPQVYWTDRGVSWSYGLQQAKDRITSAGLTAPVWMVQSNDNTPSGSAPSTADLNSFFGQAGDLTSLWEFPAAGLTSKVNQLANLGWSN